MITKQADEVKPCAGNAHAWLRAVAFAVAFGVAGAFATNMDHKGRVIATVGTVNAGTAEVTCNNPGDWKFDGQFDFRWVTLGKIVRTFARAGIGEKLIRDSIERQIASIRASLPELLDRANAVHPSEIYHDIAAGIHARIRQLAGTRK